MPIAGRLRILLASAAAVAVAALSGCDSTSPPPPGQNPRQVTVVGSGHVEGTPDTLTSNVAISFVAVDVTTAMNQTNERQRAVIDALVGAGVDKKDISTTGVSLQPQYGTDGTAIVGYQASNTIDVKIRDLGSASRVLALIVSTGGDATRINSVSYSINDDSQLVKDARTRAFNDAKDRADQYAQLSGLKLGKVISISELANGGPIPPPTMPAPRAMATEVPLSPGQQTVSFSVTVAWELG
jgi:uncharacterized protein